MKYGEYIMKSISTAILFASLLLSPALCLAQDIYMASYRGDLDTVKSLLAENPELINSRNS